LLHSLDRVSVKEIMSYQGLFVRRNNALMSKILDRARKRGARFRVSSTLGALGRRFEPYRHESLKPIHTSDLHRLPFLLKNLTEA